VIGIDYSEGMLAIARDKARAAGADHLELRCADIARTPVPEAPFDAVVCVLGLFFVDDMAGLLRSMWRMVAPGGTLAVTVLGRSFLAPVYEPWRAAVAAERPGLAIAPPWQRTDDPPTVEGLFAEAGIAGGDVREESEPAPLARPEDWWRIVMGSALRRWITEIGPAAAARVRDHNLGWIRANGVDEVEISVIYARATRGPGAEDRS
jgi:SAM-dependent methyltransferase